MNKKELLSVAAGVCLAATVSAEGKKYIYCGWDLGRATMEELAASADLFRDTAADGVIVYPHFKDDAGKFTSWSALISSETYSSEVLDRYVPCVREFAEKSGLTENLVHVTGAPAKRLDWRDDAAWKKGGDNLAVLARFAKKAGTKGLIVDFEDYHRSRQFVLAAGDPDYETCRKIARRRGAELFRDAFKAFPDMRMLVYYFYTSEIRYVGESEQVGVLREHNDIYPAFLDGIMDVLPETARIIDGNEIGYRLESERGDFWRFAEHQHVGILPLVAPELRDKYRRQVGIAFGMYVDSYIYPKTSEYYMGPLNGSRLARFRANLAQATEVADEYVWMWNEYHPYVKWRRNERCADLLAKGTLEEALPGATATMLSVRSPSRYIDRYCAAKDNLALTKKADFSQSGGSKKAGGRLSRADFGGRKGCYVFEDAPDGWAAWWFDKLKNGEAFAVAADWKGDGAPIGRFAWRANGFWLYSVGPARLVWSSPDANGWRHGEILAVVPPGVDSGVLVLAAVQHKGEKAAYDAVRIHKIDDSKAK